MPLVLDCSHCINRTRSKAIQHIETRKKSAYMLCYSVYPVPVAFCPVFLCTDFIVVVFYSRIVIKAEFECVLIEGVLLFFTKVQITEKVI